MGFPEGFQPLIGTEEAVVDDKGRVLISKKKRERLGETFAVVQGKSGGVIVYPQFVWESLFQEIFSVETMNPAREQYTRLVLGTAEDDLKFDGQGRMVIPKRLRDEAKLNGDVLLVGCGDRIEIWNKIEWEKFHFAPEKYNADRREAIENAYSQMIRRPA
jgi:MraZ protein